MPIYLRQSTASQEIPLGPFLDSTDGDTEKTALTIANTDIKIWKTGATTLASKTSGGATHIANGRYYAVLDATDTDTIGPLVVFVHVAAALAVRLECCVLDEAVYDAMFGTVALSTYAGGDTSGVTTLLSRIASALTITTGKVDVNDKTGFSLSSAGVQAIWDALSSALTTVGSIGKRLVDDLTGDIYARIGAAGAGLTALGDARIANLDATVSSRLAPAGTLATVTNLTNAPTSGDLTATMKTSVTTAATAATPAVTVSDKTGFSLSVAGVQAIWDALSSALTTAGSIGKRIVDYLTGDIYARVGAPAGASVSADVAAVKVDSAAVKVQTDKLTFTVTNQVDSNVLDWKSATAPAMTGDAFARLGAPAGASVSADVAAVKAETASIKAKTDNLPASPAAVGSQMDLVSAPNATAITAIQAGLALQSLLTTVAGYIDTEVAAIKAKTDNLPSSPAAVGSQMDLVSAPNSTAITAIQSGLALQSLLVTVASYIDTEVAAIKAKTDLIPSAPAATSDIPSAAAVAAATLAGALAAESYAADAGTPTLSQILWMLWAALVDFSISGTTLTVKKQDGTTAMTFTLDDATTPTSRTRAT